MSPIPVTLNCPLGHSCETLRDGAIQRCRWYTEIQGLNPQTGESIHRWDCAMTWNGSV